MPVLVVYRDGSDNKTSQAGTTWAHPKGIKFRALIHGLWRPRNLVERLQLAVLNCRAIYYMTTQIDQLNYGGHRVWEYDFIAVEPRGV